MVLLNDQQRNKTVNNSLLIPTISEQKVTTAIPGALDMVKVKSTRLCETSRLTGGGEAPKT
jgi:hypothetical protein